ncbi:MAG TPA: methane monooxygenase/ammonia monooxygenase subunit B [Porticoccaceae bacterium]|nr:methane monooxygenase/ammonia monooxygenase subunit B [Porticoccaceae bacterium]
MRNQRKIIGFVVGVLTLIGAVDAAMAHGERAQEPFLRMRTIQWYDVQWSAPSVAVNEIMSVTGKFRVSPDWSWPQTTAKPETAFLNISSPGPVFVRKGSWINGVNMANSTSFETGRDYAFQVDLKGRVPGKWHVHSMLNIKNAGPIVGPGNYVEVTGDQADFTNPVETLTGEVVDIETYGLANNIKWHIIFAGLGIVWLVYWLVKPLFFSRYRAVAAGEGDALITNMDKSFSAAMLVIALGTVAYGYFSAESEYPITLPMQSARESVEPLPVSAESVTVKLERATYRVPGRSMKMRLLVTNNAETAIRLGEFTTATVRFINPDVGLMDEAARSWPSNLLADSGLTITGDNVILPGQTRILEVEAQDAAWETERLSSLIYDPDSRFGGLLFFYDEDDSRHISDVGGVLVPQFI